MSTTIYRIQNTITKLFSTGGSLPRWTKTGKVWVSRGALSNHFNVLGVERAINKYENCIVVEYELVENKLKEYDGYEEIIAWHRRHLSAELKEKERIQKLIIENKKAQLTKLQKEIKQLTDKGN